MRKYLWKHPVRLIWAIIATFLSDLLWLVFAFSLQNIIDTATAGDLNRLLWELVSGFILLMVIAFTIYLGHSARATYRKKTMVQLKNDLMNSLLSMDMDAFQSGNTARYLSVYQNDVKLFDSDYLYMIICIVSDLLLLPCAAGAMLYLNPGMALMTLALSGLSLIVPVLLGKKLANRQKENVQALEKYTVRLKDIFSGFEMIKSYGVTSQIRESHDQINRQTEQTQFRLRLMLGISSSCSYGAGRVCYIGVIAIAAILVAKGALTVGALVAVNTLMGSVLGPIWNLSDMLAAIKGSKAVRQRLEEILNTSGPARETKALLPRQMQAIELRDLSFGYSEGETVLHHINLRFEHGKKYALVGASGCGKTTLLKLLMRYYTGYQGQILFNGRSVEDFSKEDYYRQVSMIHQSVFLFDDTIYNNISLYQDFPADSLDQAVKDADLWEKISSLPQGLQAQIEEGGRNFSGGERQRLAIARAFLRNTPVLMMDEATAGLDNRTARQIDQTLTKKKDLTAIIVTHKLTEESLRGCDEIIVMKNGRIVEQGAFDPLMAQKGEFYSLFRIAN